MPSSATSRRRSWSAAEQPAGCDAGRSAPADRGDVRRRARLYHAGRALQPETLFDTLNYHLSLGAQAVLNHEGTLDKFMGDAIMAFFNAPLPQPDYALRAVAAAVEMQLRMTARAKTMPLHLRLQFGVGIACGEAVVGNIGTAQLMNYTAIGHSVNLARRLQEGAKGGQILIDESTYQAVQHYVRARSLETIEVKGFSAPVPVYEVLGLRAERESARSVALAP